MPNSLVLTSASFEHLGMIPPRHTCDGNDLSPPLQWTGVPTGTQSLALIVDDPDAPDPTAPVQTWVHWVLYNIPPHVHALAEGIAAAKLPVDALPGLNDWRRTSYGGPCPPVGKHRYFFKLFALDTQLPELNIPTKAMLCKAMQGHVLDSAELVGLYQRQH